MSGGPILAPTEYLNWHDRLGQYIHWRLCKTFVCHVKGIGVNINQQKSLQKCHRFMGLTSILVNWPDTVVKNHTDKTCFLIDMYVLSDNVSLKIFEKLSKYKDLEIEVTKMWHLNTATLPLVIGALGMVAKTALNYTLQIHGAPSLTELQKITLMGTTDILQKVLSIYQCNIYIYIYIYIYICIYVYIYI